MLSEARQAVRQRYEDRADLIKITATGGVLSLACSPQSPQSTEKEGSFVMTDGVGYRE